MPEPVSVAPAVSDWPFRIAAAAAGAAIDTAGGVLSTLTIVVVESVVLPALSVARASRVYWPSAGWLAQLVG